MSASAWSKRVLLARSFHLFLVRIAGVTASVLLGLGIARLYGAEVTGYYYLFMSVVLGGSLLSRQGFDAAMMKHISIANKDGKKSLSMSLWRHARSRVLLCSVVLAVLLAGALFTLRIFPFEGRVLVFFILLTGLVVSLQALHAVNLGALRGIGWQGYAATLEVMITPVVALLLIGIWFFSGIEDIWVPMAAYTLGVASSFALGSGLLFREFRHEKKVEVEKKAVQSISASFFIVALTAFIMDWSATYVLAILAPIEQVGIYNTCLRIVAVGGMVLIVFNNLNAPAFAVAFSSQDKNKAREIAQSGAQSCFLFGLAILAPFLIFPGVMLSVIGEDFLAGEKVLQIMAASQLANMFTGSVGHFLLMSGNEKALRRLSISCLTVFLLLLYPMTSAYGMYGAAAVWAFVSVFRNSASVILAYKSTNVLVIPTFIARPIEKVIQKNGR